MAAALRLGLEDIKFLINNLVFFRIDIYEIRNCPKFFRKFFFLPILITVRSLLFVKKRFFFLKKKKIRIVLF